MSITKAILVYILIKKNFENKYGTEKQILDIVRERVIEQDELSSINFL